LLIILTISEDGRAVLRALYEKQHRKMLYTATQLLGKKRGEEAVHDVFVKIIEKFENNFEELCDKPGQYFVIMARNHSINLLKKEKLRLIPFEAEMMNGDIFQTPFVNPEDAALDAEANDRLTALIRRLTPITRQILEYKYIMEYSNKEIAELLGVSQSVVSTRIERAKSKLKELLESEEADTHG
jgi:RNA polymerase sigma-70 factor (ECF subfamily)